MEKLANTNKEVTTTVADAIKSFIDKTNLSEDAISVTVIDPSCKVIIRVPNGNVQLLREAEKTIYHGSLFDVFTFQCITGKSGILTYDDVLTDEYKYKCSC